MLSIVVFNVELGQSILFLPEGAPEYAMLVDCGNTPYFEPVNFFYDILAPNPGDSNHRLLGNLTITNYDEDHFSGLPYLLKKVFIKTVSLSNNLSVDDIRAVKQEITEPIKELCHLKRTYTNPATNYNPPFTKTIFSLTKQDFASDNWDTNKLSQLVFVSYCDSTICIPGDLLKESWDILLQRTPVREALKKTNVFVAPHHGREDGYNANVFLYCKPDCIIISDKSKIHSTQENMTTKYAGHVTGNGVSFQSDKNNPRRVLTSRADGTIFILFLQNGARLYDNFKR